MARLPYPDPAAMPDEVRETLDALPARLNVFRMMAHAEANVRPLVALGSSILLRQRLDPRLRELAILRVARLSQAEYEWVQHVPIAKAVGTSDAEVAALERGDVADACFDVRTRAVLDFVTDVVENVRASDDRLRALRAHLDEREVVELLLAVGYYMMIARLLETTGVDLEPPLESSIIDAHR